VAAYEAARQGAVISLQGLGGAARDDLSRLNATLMASEHPRFTANPGKAATLARAAQVLITEALLDNKDASAVEPLVAVLGPAPEACALQMTGLAEDMTAKFRMAPVTSVVWAGLTVLPGCAPRSELPADGSVLAQLITNAGKFGRARVEPARSFLRPLTESSREGSDQPAGGAKNAAEEKPATGETSAEPKAGDRKAVPGALRYLVLRLRAAAALAEVLPNGTEEAATAGAGNWLRSFAESLEISAAIAIDDYAGAVARAARRLGVSRGAELRHVDMIVVLATGSDESQMERSLADAASPAGSGRVKARKGAFNVTLSALPGVLTAMELRRGYYGTTHEPAQAVYYQAPALQLPLGFDLAWGRGTHSAGLFISTIDPLAFLQYDVHRQGRLPGPSVLTALAPGVAVRVSLGRSPISLLLPFITFRPGFRAWEPSVAGRGASALQIGVALSVDLVLHSLVSRRK